MTGGNNNIAHRTKPKKAAKTHKITAAAAVQKGFKVMNIHHQFVRCIECTLEKRYNIKYILKQQNHLIRT